jgi:hypothetical protein
MAGIPRRPPRISLGALRASPSVRKAIPMRLARCVFPCLFFSLIALGCGNGFVKAKGRVLKNGEPFRPGEGEALRIILAPMDPPAGNTYDSYAAEFHPEDSTFQVKGKDGSGLPPGKYRVSVELLKHKEDLFKGALNGRRSPLTCDVTSASSELVVDLDQAKGSAPKESDAPRTRRREDR